MILVPKSRRKISPKQRNTKDKPAVKEDEGPGLLDTILENVNVNDLLIGGGALAAVTVVGAGAVALRSQLMSTKEDRTDKQPKGRGRGKAGAGSKRRKKVTAGAGSKSRRRMTAMGTTSKKNQ